MTTLEQPLRRAGVIRRGVAPSARRRDVLILLGPCVAYLIAFSVFPLLYSLWVSFQSYDSRADTFTYIGLDNYRELLSSDTFWEASRNTAVFTFGAVGLQVLLGVALALFFDQRLRGAAIVRGILMLPMLVTPVVVGLMFRALLNPDWGMVPYLSAKVGLPDVGWLSDPAVAIWTLVIADVWQWTPFVFLLVYARLQALPHEVFEAASVDGASWFGRTWHVTFPLLWPAIAFAAIFRAIDAFRTFDLVFALTGGGPGNSTRTLSFEAFQSGFSFFRYGYASAVAYVMVIIATVMMTVLFRFITVRREEPA